MSSKITIVGVGAVGATIANDLVVMGIGGEILLIDANKEKAFGEAMDIFHQTPFCSPCDVHSGNYKDAANSDIVIITCGMPRRPGQTRLDLAQINSFILKDVAKKIYNYAPDAIYIIVTNPVDIMTYVFQKFTGIPSERVIGTGTLLDTIRLQAVLANTFSVSPKNVHAYVYGEHGDSSFIPWSLVTIANNPISQYKDFSPNPENIAFDGDFTEIENRIHIAGEKIIRAKGATYYAISVAVCHMVRCILNGYGTALPVSTMMNDEYGISDVCLSVLRIIGKNGASRAILNELSETEQALLQKSAKKLKETISSIDF